jgi:CBS domain-containing protein
MSQNVEFCAEDENVEDAVRQMEKKQIRRLPVRNKKDQVVGMLAMADISRRVPHSMSGELIESMSEER